MDKKAFYTLSYGLFVLCAKEGEKNGGCIVNTAIQAATGPEKLTVCVNKENFTAEMIQRTRTFNLSVLSEDAPFSLFERFGFQTGRETDKWADFEDKKQAENGIFYVTKGTSAYFSCEVESVVDVGSHFMFVATVTACEMLSSASPMTYAYYFDHVKPKPAEKKGVFVCKICGYVYDEEKTGVKFEDLPDDWVCPLCKHPKSDFARQ